MKIPQTYGLMAEFEDPTDLVNAAHSAYEEGYRRMDAFSPFPIEELSEAIGFHHTKLPIIVFFGGKPLFSWPAFVPPAFEMTILFAALSAVLGMLALNGLPEPYHPVFNVSRFALATRNRFFLLIEAVDPKFDLDKTRRFLETLTPRNVSEVEP